jgi:hypothetical protein
MVVPLAFGDELISGPDLMRVLEGPISSPTQDRRKRIRLKLSWSVLLRSSSSDKFAEGRTKDVSSDGFYCVVSEPIEVASEVLFTILVPIYDGDRRPDVMRLEGQARVLRFDALGNDLYGIACQIRDYRVRSAGDGSPSPT